MDYTQNEKLQIDWLDKAIDSGAIAMQLENAICLSCNDKPSNDAYHSPQKARDFLERHWNETRNRNC